MKKIIQGLILIIAVSGCAHTFEPRPETYDIDAITEFIAPVNISVLNVQTDSTDHVQLSNMGHTFSGNLKSWTTAAVEIAKRELIERQATISEDAQRRLELSIISIDGETGFTVFRYVTKLKVRAGSGYENIYTGSNRSGAIVYRAADGAVMRAVTEMFKDPEIVKYISSGE